MAELKEKGSTDSVANSKSVKTMNNLETHEDMHKAWGFKPVSNRTTSAPDVLHIKTTVNLDMSKAGKPTTTIKLRVLSFDVFANCSQQHTPKQSPSSKR